MPSLSAWPTISSFADQSKPLAGGFTGNKVTKLVCILVIIIVAVLIVYAIYHAAAPSKSKSIPELFESWGPKKEGDESASGTRAAMRGSIMDQSMTHTREVAEGEFDRAQSATEESAGARSLPSATDLAEQSMQMYDEIAKHQKERVQMEGESPMFHSQFYYEEGVEQHAEPGSGDADREVMKNLVSATGGLLTQAEDLFAAGNEVNERDAWGMYKPSLATLQRARDQGSRVSGGTLTQATEGWGGRKIGGNPVTADPSRSLYGLQDQLADTTKVAVDSTIVRMLNGDMSTGSQLPASQLPSYL